MTHAVTLLLCLYVHRTGKVLSVRGLLCRGKKLPWRSKLLEERKNDPLGAGKGHG